MRDVIVFGAGTLGREILPSIEETKHILFFVDNDEAKWGSMFGQYMIKPPAEISSHVCDIVIASSVRGDAQIARQLGQIGVARDRIYLCCKVPADDGFKGEIYQADTRVPLIRYDLYCSEESRTDHLKVLIACSFCSTYTKQLIENLSKRYEDIEFSLLTKALENKEKIVSKQLKHIYCFQTAKELKMILEQLPIYDAIQCLWIEGYWCQFQQLMRHRSKRLNLNVGGSDFYRANKEQLDNKKELIACADKVTAETEGTIQDFTEYYGELVKDKMGLLPFGIEVLDFIKFHRNSSKNAIKEKFRIPQNKIIVTCGHNGGKAHQHIKIIEAMSCLERSVRDRLLCVFPMTYPKDDDYICEVHEKARECGLNHRILTEFMDFEQMAEYALISDIMIHVQTTDQLSSTMLEEMYAGSIIIAGSWLPYQSLHRMGMYFLDVDAISEVTSAVHKAVMNMDEYKKRCEGNREIVWEHSSWDGLAPKWRELWDS